MLSTDYRLADAQRDFAKSNQDRAVVWRSGSPTVRSGEEGEEKKRERRKEQEETGKEKDDEYVDNMEAVYEGVEREALAVRDRLEKSGADPDNRRDLVVLAARLIEENEKLIGGKRGKKGKGLKVESRSKSEACLSGNRRDVSEERLTKSSSYRQVNDITSESSGEEE